MQSLHEIVRSAEDNYLEGETQISEHVSWSMHDTVENIDAYLNSKHITGSTDSLGREKPFFNIVTAAVNVWYRATDLDRKDIKFIPTAIKANILAFVANVILQNWMVENSFGVFLNNWGRTLARYGSAVVKFVDKGDTLVATVIPWNRLIVDPVDFYALPVIEKFYKTPSQLRKVKEYDQTVVDNLINTLQSRETQKGSKKDNRNEFIEIYEVHGELDSRFLDEYFDESVADEDIKYVQQMHVIAYCQNKSGEYQDYTLYRGRESKNPYMITHLIEEDGRTLAIGAVEHLFDAQWMANHTVKNMKDTLDIASRLIFQTADTRYAGRNVLSAIESGDLFIHEPNMPLTRVANDKPDITALQNFGQMFIQNGQEITSTPEALRGTTLPSGTPYSLGAYLGGQAGSLFEIMTENKGLALEEMIRMYLIPHIKKQLKHKDEIVGILDDAGIAEIDSLYLPYAAIKRFNERSIQQIVAAIEDPNAPLPEPFNPEKEQMDVQKELSSQGNKRFFTPEELTWDEVFSDFEWDNVRVEITNEQQDKQAVFTTLATVLQAIGSNPAILQDPNAKLIFNKILQETSVISPIQLSVAGAKPSPLTTSPDITNLSNLAKQNETTTS